MISDNPIIKNIIDRCRKNPGRVIFPEGNDPRVIEATSILLKLNAVQEITLLTTSGSTPSWPDDTRLKILNTDDVALCQLSMETHQAFLRKKNKETDPASLSKVARDPLYQAGALLNQGSSDCVVAGCVATTADVIRAALATVGLASGIKTVSGSFIMSRFSGNKDETFVYGDCGVVIDPGSEQLTDIAVASCETFQKITGRAPVVAFLSFSTKGSATHPDSVKMHQAYEQFRQRAPSIECDGELQFDAAYIAGIGHRKAPGSKVPGRANCFIFPDLGAGNIAYKITERLAGFSAYGPILQGLTRPYSDLSRGASAEDIAISALINILRAR